MPGATKPRKKAVSAKTAWVDVEADPTGRFTRSNHVLGRGASKVVYKGFDRHQGIEVAWNQVKIVEHLTSKEHARLESEVAVLRRLKHRNIMTFYASWIDSQQHTLNFITEYFHPGPLRRHRRNHKHLSRRVLKRWAWQILEGLIYLHGHMPPIIHRDLKCDNIFIHGTTGAVKIGDLGLAKLMEEGLSTCQSVLGTPEFMAPELYREKYNEKVDIYSFGMCLLELVTMEFPYRECKNKAQIFRQVTLGMYPAALGRIEDAETRSFIELCIDHFHERRPFARELIKHPFFDDVRPQRPNSPFRPIGGLGSESGRESGHDSSENDNPIPSPVPSPDLVLQKPERPDIAPRPPTAPLPKISAGDGAQNRPGPMNGLARHPSSPLLMNGRSNSTEAHAIQRQLSTPLPLERTFSVQQRGMEGSILDFELCMMRNEGTDFRRFKFTYDMEMDTVQAVAEEFEEEFGLTPTETESFIGLLKEELERMQPKERFIPVESMGPDDSRGGSDMQARLAMQNSIRSNGTAGDDDICGRASLGGPRKTGSRKFTPRASPRIIPHPDEEYSRGRPNVLSPMSPANLNRSPRRLPGHGPSEPDSDTRASSGGSGDQGVVLMRVSGDRMVGQQCPRRPANPNSMPRPQHPQQSRPFIVEGMEGMREHRPSPEGIEGNEFSGSLKAYRGDQQPTRAQQEAGWEHPSPRAVSPDPPDLRNFSSYESRSIPQQPTSEGESGVNPQYGQGYSSRGYQNPPVAPEQNWGYHNNGVMQGQERNQHRMGYQGSAPASVYQQQILGQQNTSFSNHHNGMVQRNSTAPKQERWTEPGFHMPMCGPFPKSLQKIRSLFSDRHGKGSRY